MQAVFIAHAPGDEAAALIVDAYLRASGFNTRRTLDNRDLPTHAPDQTTQHWQALRATDVFVLLWSQRTEESVKVTCDWQYALRRKIPIFILWLDSTPLPPLLSVTIRVAGLPGPDTLPRLVRMLKVVPQPALAFYQPIETAFVDFGCWFFDDFQWRYDYAHSLLPLTVRGIPNLPPELPLRVKFLKQPLENIWPLYVAVSRPEPLFVLEFDAEAYEKFYFFQAAGWLYDGEKWEPYTWVQCENCQRWQLADDADEEAGIYELWCPHCASEGYEPDN